MITLSQFSQQHLFWLQDIPDICVTSSATEDVHVSVKVGTIEVFKETIVPDKDNNIILKNIKSLLEYFFDNSYKIEVKINNSYNAEVIYSRRSISNRDYLHFITLSLSKIHNASIKDSVTIAFVKFSEKIYVTVKAYARKESGEIISKDIDYFEDEQEAFKYIEKSYSLSSIFNADELKNHTPISLTAEDSDNILWECRILNHTSNVIRIKFYNNFNIEETVAIEGKITVKNEQDKVLASINNNNTIISSIETAIYTVETGPLSYDDVLILQDIVSSKKVSAFFLGSFYEITIKESEISFAKNNTEFSTAKFSFVRSSSPAELIEL